jgi:DNA-binding transcriptional LysR family regulator
MARIPLRRFFRHGFLPQIMAFEATVRLGSVTRAAEELSLAQPTVSCMLRKLSDTLGGPVTVMRDRRIEASPLGHEVLLLCHDMFRAMERFEGYDRPDQTLTSLPHAAHPSRQEVPHA